jgi:hypothetical protein
MNWRSLGLLVCAATCACDSHSHSGTVAGLPDRPAVVPPFTVTVALTPNARAELEHRKETIKVLAIFYGDANARGGQYANHTGQISWSKEEELELARPGVARFRSRRINLALLDYFQDRKAEVLINVFSGRRSSDLNLLDCGIFEDSVYLAAKEGVQIRCDLI